MNEIAIKHSRDVTIIDLKNSSAHAHEYPVRPMIMGEAQDRMPGMSTGAFRHRSKLCVASRDKVRVSRRSILSICNSHS